MTSNVHRLHENSQELRFASESIILVLFKRSVVLVLLQLLIVFYVYLYVSNEGHYWSMNCQNEYTNCQKRDTLSKQGH
jgi:hypothetical protein